MSRRRQSQVYEELDEEEMQRRQKTQEKIPLGDQILNDMLTQQRENFITDLFALMAAVLRDRTGPILGQAGDTQWDDIIRFKDLQIFVFSMMGVVCNVAIATIFWYNENFTYVDGVKQRADIVLQETNNTRKSGLYAFQLALTMTTVITCCLIVQKYKLLVAEKRREWSGIDTYNYVQAAEGARNQEEEQKEDAKKAKLANAAAQAAERAGDKMRLMQLHRIREEEEARQLQEQVSRQNAQKVLDKYDAAYSFWRSPLRWICFAELMIQMVHPTIWMNTPDSYTRTIYEVLEVLIFARLYLGVQVVYSFSREYKARHKILASNLELQRSGFQITKNGTLKMLFFKYPVLFSTSLLVVALTNLGFIVFILERRFQPGTDLFGKLENAFWFGFVTFSTVGYGDMAPISPLGRIASIFIGAAGITVTTIVGGVATNLMVQTREQRYVAEYLKMVMAADKNRMSAARTIQAAWRYYRIKIGQIQNPWMSEGHKSNFVYANIKEFRSHRWEVSQSKSTANDPVIDSKMNRLSGSLVDTVKTLEKHEKSVTATTTNIESYVREFARLLEQ